MFKSSLVFVSSSILSLTIVWSLDLLDFWVWLIVAGGRLCDRAIGLGSAERVGARAAASAMQLSLRRRRMVSLCAEVQRYRFNTRARLRCGLLCWERYAQSPQLVLVATQQLCCDRCDGFRSTPEQNCVRSDDP